jgi:hypothetical protein
MCSTILYEYVQVEHLHEVHTELRKGQGVQ